MSTLRQCLIASTFLLALSAAGCRTTDTPLLGGAINDLTGKPNAREARLSTAAADAVAAGKTEEAVEKYRELYAVKGIGFFSPAKNRKEIALNYAQLLRKTEIGRAHV